MEHQREVRDLRRRLDLARLLDWVGRQEEAMEVLRKARAEHAEAIEPALRAFHHRQASAREALRNLSGEVRRQAGKAQLSASEKEDVRDAVADVIGDATTASASRQADAFVSVAAELDHLVKRHEPEATKEPPTRGNDREDVDSQPDVEPDEVLLLPEAPVRLTLDETYVLLMPVSERRLEIRAVNPGQGLEPVPDAAAEFLSELEGVELLDYEPGDPITFVWDAPEAVIEAILLSRGVLRAHVTMKRAGDGTRAARMIVELARKATSPTAPR